MMCLTFDQMSSLGPHGSLVFLAVQPYKCHHYTVEEQSAIDQGDTGVCEREPGRILTANINNNIDYPGCGDCWCCEGKSD